MSTSSNQVVRAEKRISARRNRWMAVGTLILRADASEETGLGHVMRCLSVAEVWQEPGARCGCGTCCMGAAARDRLSTAGVGVEFSDAAAGSDSDAAQLVRSARERGEAW